MELKAGEAAGEGAVEKAFSGGLYAVIRVVGVSNIMPTWKRLVAWMEESPYEHGGHQWLEQDVGPPDSSDETLTLDLYLPIEG